MSATSKAAYQNIAAFINEVRDERVRLARDKTTKTEINKVKQKTDEVMTWLGVMTKYVETLEGMVNGEQLAAFDLAAFTKPKEKKVRQKAIKPY